MRRNAGSCEGCERPLDRGAKVEGKPEPVDGDGGGPVPGLVFGCTLPPPPRPPPGTMNDALRLTGAGNENRLDFDEDEGPAVVGEVANVEEKNDRLREDGAAGAAGVVCE